MDLTELNPPKVVARLDANFPVVAQIDKNALELRYFDLRAIVWASGFFGSLQAMNSYLNDHDHEIFSDVVAEVIFHLISDEDREDIFQGSPCYFKRLISETPEKDGGPERTIAVFFDALQKVFANSFPDPPEHEPANTQQGKKQQESTPECWAKIFIEVSNYIKCNLDEFYAFTSRQIETFITQINVLKVQNLEYQAMSMQPGVKFNITGGNNQTKKDVFTDADIKEIMADQKIFMEQFPA